MNKKKMVVLTGAGISAESGISTFRDVNGLWEGYDIQEVASPNGWSKNRNLVLDFYNKRRKNVIESVPNLAHKILVDLEDFFDIRIITQNVDDLHERAGSKYIVHLHGEIRKSRSTLNSNLTFDIDGWELNVGDKCPLGSQLRPHIVWFGEDVPLINDAIELVENADVFLIIGTSLLVYPAAGLIQFAKENIQKYYIDANPAEVKGINHLKVVNQKATVGMQMLYKELTQ